MKTPGSIPVGKNVVIRTVTHYYTGHLVNVDEFGLVLQSAAWIPDTGRWTDFLTKGKASEVEPYPPGLDVTISLASIVDICEWKHSLLTVQK